MASNYFLKIDGIPGESLDSKHKDEIEVLSWSWGETNDTPVNPGGGAGSGKVAMTDLQVSTLLSRASPQLLLACASGKHIKSAVLTGRKAGKGQQEYLSFSLSDVLVSGYQTGASGDEVPVDSISLNFSRIEVSYKQSKADGSLAKAIRAGWDRKTNKSF
jgi:type VI secretion system secreted protein Hcp